MTWLCCRLGLEKTVVSFPRSISLHHFANFSPFSKLFTILHTFHHFANFSTSWKLFTILHTLQATWEFHVQLSTPCLNEKIDSGKSHLQDLARWWRTSQRVVIPTISQFYWALFEKTRFLCFYIIKSSKKRAKIEPKYP